MKRKAISMIAVFVALSFCLSLPSMAQNYKTTFVSLAPGVPGLLYEPVTPGPKAAIGVVAMHNRGDYLSAHASSPCLQLAERGYRALCANTSTSKSGFVADDDIDKMVLNVKSAVAYLRKYPGIQKVLILGHSGGGALMASYQNIAENGVKSCQGPEKILACPDSLAGMPPADGVILLDVTFGETMTMYHLDPAVVDENNGRMLNPDVNMYNPANGFNPKGSTYSDQFKARFFAAQRDRLNKLIQIAQDRLALIKAGKGNYVDDEPFVIPGYSTQGGKLFSMDLSLWAHSRKAWPLLHPDGSVTTEVIHSVRVPSFLESPTPSYSRGALTTTVRRFLGTMAIRPTEKFGYDASSIYGVDYNSSYENTVNGLEGITKPVLQMGMTGNFEYFMAETMHEHTKSADTTLAYVEGAVHGFTPCTKCAVAQGKPENYYGDTVKTLFDYVDGWLSKPGRFLAK